MIDFILTVAMTLFGITAAVSCLLLMIVLLTGGVR